jgi:hypothetical protein
MVLESGYSSIMLRMQPTIHFVHNTFEHMPMERIYVLTGSIPHLTFRIAQRIESGKTNKEYSLAQLLDCVNNFREKACITDIITTKQEQQKPYPSPKSSVTHIFIEAKNDTGKFILYSDGRIRCRFVDRTILQLYTSGICDIITKYGNVIQTTEVHPFEEVKAYMQHAIDFRNWAMRSEEEKKLEKTEREEFLQLKEEAGEALERSSTLLQIFSHRASE